MRTVHTLATLGLAATLLSLTACGDETTEETAPQETLITFQGYVGDAPFSCDATYKLGTAQTDATISEFKAFVSAFSLKTSAGRTLDAKLVTNAWQNEHVALLDFEDATGACQNGTPETNGTVTLTHDALKDGESITEVAFSIGVPFEANHQDTTTAPAPLDKTAMFWNWQGGYKFLRVDGKAGNAGFRMHVGSTGCMQNDENVVTSCAKPNRATISLTGMSGAPTVRFDVAKLLEGVDLTPSMEGASAVCMSAPDHAACAAPFAALGLSFGDNTPAQSFATAVSAQ